MTGRLPDPFKGMPQTGVQSQDWRLLDQLIARYGVDKLVRALRIRQMIHILDVQETPQDAYQPPSEPD